MKYAVNGNAIEAATSADLVSQMHKASFDPDGTDQEFMVATASRVRLQNGQQVRSDTADHFVADLIAAGMITSSSN